MGFCVGSSFYDAVLGVLSTFAIILLRNALGNPGVIHSIPTAFMQWVWNGSRLGYRG